MPSRFWLNLEFGKKRNLEKFVLREIRAFQVSVNLTKCQFFQKKLSGGGKKMNFDMIFKIKFLFCAHSRGVLGGVIFNLFFLHVLSFWTDLLVMVGYVGSCMVVLFGRTCHMLIQDISDLRVVTVSHSLLVSILLLITRF